MCAMQETKIYYCSRRRDHDRTHNATHLGHVPAGAGPPRVLIAGRVGCAQQMTRVPRGADGRGQSSRRYDCPHNPSCIVTRAYKYTS